MSAAVIAAIAASILVAVGLTALILYCCVIKKRKNKHNKENKPHVNDALLNAFGRAKREEKEDQGSSRRDRRDAELGSASKNNASGSKSAMSTSDFVSGTSREHHRDSVVIHPSSLNRKKTSQDWGEDLGAASPDVSDSSPGKKTKKEKKSKEKSSKR